MRRLQTAMPDGVWRSSGSRVRLPTSTTRLMLAAILRSSPSGRFRLLRGPVGVAGSRGCDGGRGLRRRLLVHGALHAPERAVAHHAVRDLEHARDLRERLGGRAEEEEVVDGLALVVDLVGEAAATPRLVAVPGAAGTVDGVANALDDLVRPRLSELRVQQQHDLVLVQPEYLPSRMLHSHGLNRPRLLDAASGRRRDGRDEKRRKCSIGRMKRLLAVVAGGLGLGALLRRRSRRTQAPSPADDLRAKLAESKAQDEVAAEAPPAPQTVEERRADV